MFTITLDKSSSRFTPGDSIKGIVEWTDLSEKTDRFEIRLIWYTEGKGTTDVEVIETTTESSPGPSGRAKFKFVAPTRPFSFSGKLISLIWAIEVVDFPSRDGTKETLVISANGNEILLEKSFPDESIQGKIKKRLEEKLRARLERSRNQ